MKTVWKKRSSINCIDAHKDYLNDIDRIAAKDFKPNQQDILISRVRTTQVIQEKYRIDNVEFEIIDGKNTKLLCGANYNNWKCMFMYAIKPANWVYVKFA